MKPFRYDRARDIPGAVATLDRERAGVFLAGGTNLVDLMKLGVMEPDVLVDVRRLTSAEIEDLPGGGLRIGAAVSNSELAADWRIRTRYPALSQALLSGASGQLRNVATTGGNLVQRTRCVYFYDTTTPCNKREPGTGCPAVDGCNKDHAILGASPHCVATHPSDMAVAMTALDAVVRVQGPGGERAVPITGLYRLPGQDPQRDTTLEHAELITAVDLPPAGFSSNSRYRKVRERASYAFALVSVAAALLVRDGVVGDVRIALGGVGHRPWRAEKAERALRGRPAVQASFRAAAEAELADAAPLRDNAYKVPLAANVMTRTLLDLATVLANHGGGPMTTITERRAIGTPLHRLDGPEKVTGTARYAYEHRFDNPLYLFPVQSEVARGRVTRIDGSAAEALPGVVAVLTHENVPRLADTSDREFAVLQAGDVAFRGQYVAAAVAETLEIARYAASLVRVTYETEPHDAELRADRDDLYAPDVVNPSYPTDTQEGDFDGAFAAAAVKLDETYTTPMEHNNPMEPHATVALWEAGDLTLYESTQGPHRDAGTLAQVFGLDRDRVRIIAPYVGGGFGSKTLHANTVLAALAAQVFAGSPVKFALTRQQMFSGVGYRTPTIQRIRLGADRDGRLVAIAHDVIEQTAKTKEFAENTAVPTRMMYATASRRTTHRLAALDVPVPSWMRAPGEAPGMFALESAMDEMAIRCGIDPVEFRIRNEPEIDAETGLPYSSRNLVACLREGARRFGWADRDPRPGRRRDGRWYAGTGVAASTFPVIRFPGSVARISHAGDGRYVVEIGAADIGTGTWTALTQIAADALGTDVERIDLRIGDTTLPEASVEGGSSGIASWGTAIFEAARVFRDRYGYSPSAGDQAEAAASDNPEAGSYSMHAFGACFAMALVDADTGEVRIPHMTGVFAAGRIINPKTARSQIIGGMTMGLGMALHEESLVDARFGHVMNHDFAGYHIPANADAGQFDIAWIDEEDRHVNPMGSKGIGEIGIVGSSAAIANAVYHATGFRVRDLPITPAKLMG